jgi:hypothetical protein
MGAAGENCGVEEGSTDAVMELQRACGAEDVPTRVASRCAPPTTLLVSALSVA